MNGSLRGCLFMSDAASMPMESTVIVFGIEALHKINDYVSELGNGISTVALDVLATAGNNNAYYTQGEVTLVFGPEHAEMIDRDGFSVKVFVAGGTGKHSMAIHSFGETHFVTKSIDEGA